MLNEKEMSTSGNSLVYNKPQNSLELDGHALQSDEPLEVRVFGSWIPGQLKVDASGWYLLTPDHVSIRLDTGLSARFSTGYRPGAPSQETPLTKTPHLLIVDDDPALLRALPQTLSLRLPGVQVEVASEAQSALKLIQENDYDVITSDIKMPGMDGLTLLTKIHELRPETPMLLITGHSDHDLAIQALRGGAYDYILKPIDRDTFIAAVRRAVHMRQLRRLVAEQQLLLELHARSLERLIQQRTLELVEANETKDKVISLVSQELQGPLARLKDMVWLLHQKLNGPDMVEVVQKGFAEIEQAIKHTETLVNELRHTSAIETTRFILHREHCDLMALCRDVLQGYIAGTRMRLTGNFSSGSLYVEIDRERVTHLLTTLLSSAHNATIKDTPITITLQKAGQEAILMIRSNSPYAGWELELSISRHTLERHNGRLEIQRFPDDRSAFFVILPLLNSTSPGEMDHTPPLRTQAVWRISPQGDEENHTTPQP